MSEDYRVEISGLEGASGRLKSESKAPSAAAPGRPWLSIRWQCCGAYSRVYKSANGKTYDGRCPRCHRQLSIPIGPGGTNSRSFEAW